MELQRYGLVFVGVLIIALVLAAPVSAARAHPAGSFNLTTVPDPAPYGTPAMDVSSRAMFDAAVAGDMSALAPPPVPTAFDSIGPGDSLQDAIDAAPDGSTIYLDPGTYYEHDLVVNKVIMIQANQSLGGTRANTIIDARGEGRIFTVESGDLLFLDNLTLQNGLGSGNGGAISTTGGDIVIIYTTITNCSATGDGGAIYSHGGAVFVLYSAVSRCSVTGSGAGGAIYSEDGMVLVGYSTVSGCSAPGGWGGAIEADSPLIVGFSTFTRCSALDGGALHFYEDGAMVFDTTFTDCTAAGNGGAIWFLDGGSAGISGSSFTRCSAAEDGGAIAGNGDLVIESSTFSVCSAGGDGGAIFTRPAGALTATSSSFTGCSAAGEGGAVYSRSSLSIISSNLTGNTAPRGGAVSMPGSTGTISFSRFYQNTADHGPAISVMGDVNAENNWWGTNDGPAGQIQGWYHATPWLVLGITADPASITLPQTSSIRTNLTHNSDGTNTAGGGIFVPDAITNTYAVTSGPGIVAPVSTGTRNGAAQTTYITLKPGTTTIAGTVDGQTVYINLNVDQGTWTPLPTVVPNDDDWPQVGNGAPGGGGGGTAATTGSSAFPLMTVSLNIGGDSKARQAIVTGTKLSDLIVTGTVQYGSGGNFTAPPGVIFQYISLVPARYDTITKAVINFTVPQSWLDDNHIATGSIVLYHQTANGWEALPTTVLSTKDGTVYFLAQSGSFSLFAIAGTPAVATPSVTATASQGIMNEVVQTPAPAAALMKVPVTTQTTATPAATPQPAAPSPLLNIVLVIAAIGMLAGGGFMARRWWIRRQNPALFEDYD